MIFVQVKFSILFVCFFLVCLKEAMDFEYSVFVWKHTSNHDILLDAKAGSILREMYDLGMKDREEAFVHGTRVLVTRTREIY